MYIIRKLITLYKYDFYQFVINIILVYEHIKSFEDWSNIIILFQRFLRKMYYIC